MDGRLNAIIVRYATGHHAQSMGRTRGVARRLCSVDIRQTQSHLRHHKGPLRLRQCDHGATKPSFVHWNKRSAAALAAVGLEDMHHAESLQDGDEQLAHMRIVVHHQNFQFVELIRRARPAGQTRTIP